MAERHIPGLALATAGALLAGMATAVELQALRLATGIDKIDSTVIYNARTKKNAYSLDITTQGGLPGVFGAASGTEIAIDPGAGDFAFRSGSTYHYKDTNGNDQYFVVETTIIPEQGLSLVLSGKGNKPILISTSKPSDKK